MISRPEHTLTGIRREVRQVRDWLLMPTADAVAASAATLEQAAAAMTDLASRIEPGRNPPLRSAIVELAAEIRAAEALLRAGGELYLGRLRQYASHMGW